MHKVMSASGELAKLTERAKEAEERGVAARSQAKDEVERSVNEARIEAQAQADKLRETVEATGSRVSASWNDLQTSWAKHIAKVREDMDAKKAGLDAKKAEIRADDAEDDAMFAVDFAYGAIEEAEYAVLHAIAARKDADELAAS
jgi:hypothetical protein